MTIRSRGVNARDKAFTNAYNNAKQRGELDFYNEMMEYTSKNGYQDLFVQRYNSMDESQRQKIQDLLYNIDDEYKAQTAFQEMTIDLLDNNEKKTFSVIKYDENDDPILNETKDGYVEEDVEMTEQEHARYILDRLYKSSQKKLAYDYTLKQQQNYKDNLAWYHKAVRDISGTIQRFDYGIKESITGLIDFVGAIGNAIGVGIAEGRDGYREYYEKYALGKNLQETMGVNLQEFERLYTDYRDVFTGEYTTLGKYLQGAVQTVGNMFTFFLIPGGAGAGVSSKVMSGVKTGLYYSSMYSTGQTTTFNDPDFANVSTLAIVFNGALKTAAEVAIEKGLSKVLGRVTSLDKRLGTNTVKGMTNYVDKMISKGGKTATRGMSKLEKFFSQGGKVVGKYIGDAIQEGVEEALQELSGMLIDRMFDSKGETFFKEGWNFQNVLDAAIIGSIVSGSMSTVNFMATKRVKTGNMEEVIDEKTGDSRFIEKKLSKVESIIYNAQVENLYASYNQLLDNARKEGDADTGAFWAAQAYQSYSILMEYFKGVGAERSASALQLLQEIQKSPEKTKVLMSVEYVDNLVKSFKNSASANRIITQSPEFLERMRNAGITQGTPISKESINNMTPEWRKVLQERWKDHPDFQLISTDGNNIVVNEDSSVIMIPEAWFKEGALDVFKTVAEREVANEVYKELYENEKDLLDLIVKEYIEWSGETDATADKALYALLFDSHYYSTFMYAHWNNPIIWQIFSRLNDVAKTILTSSNIQNALTKLALKKIERSMKKSLMEIAKSTNVEYESVTVFTQKDKQEIRQSDIRNRGNVMKSIDRLKQNLKLNLEDAKSTIDKMKSKVKSENTQKVLDIVDKAYKVLNDFTSSRIEVMDAMMTLYSLMPELFDKGQYFISMYTGTSTENTLPKDVVDVLTIDAPIYSSASTISDYKQKVLDSINSITYEDKTQKYNATFGKDNQLFVYQNIEASSIFNEDFINDPLMYILSIKKKKSDVTIYDLVKHNYKYSKDALTILKNTKIYLSSDMIAEIEGSHDIKLNEINIVIDKESKDIYFKQSNDIRTRSDVIEDVKNTIYHEVNHALRSVSSDERYSYAPDALQITPELKEYLNENFKLYIASQYLLEKKSNPTLSDEQIYDNVYHGILYLTDDKEMNAFNMKQAVFISPDKDAQVYTANGFNFQDDYIITPTHTKIDVPLEDKIAYKMINAKLKSMSEKMFNESIHEADVPMMQMGKTAGGTTRSTSSKKVAETRESYMKALISNQKSAKVMSTYDLEFRNDVYRGVKDIIKSSVPKIYRDTARVNDIINDPEKYLSDEVKQEVTDDYGSLSKNNVMKYLQRYFYTKYKKSVDLTFTDGKNPQVVFVNIKNFTEYESDILKVAKYDGVDNSLSEFVKDFEYTTSTGKNKKGIMPVSMLVNKEQNFGLVSRAVIRISETEGPHYDRGVITLKSPKNNNDFRYQFAHEFQHLLDEANALSGGTSNTFQVTTDMIKDLKEHVPGYIPTKANVATQIKLVRDYVYHQSGERKAYGVTWLDADFVHIERTKKGEHIAHMPWGSKWTLTEATTQEGRASIIKIAPERKSVPIGPARRHWLMKHYIKDEHTSIAQTQSLTNFIFDLTEENFKLLDEELQQALLSYEMTSAQLLEYVRTTEDMNQFTFDMINKHFFGNTYFKSLKEIDNFLKDLSTWNALYWTLKDDPKYDEYLSEIITSDKIKSLLDIIKKDKTLYAKFEKQRELYWTRNKSDYQDETNSIRASTWANMNGTLLEAFKMVANQMFTVRKIEARGNFGDRNAAMLGRQNRGVATQATRKTFSEVKEKTEDMRDALSLIPTENKLQFIANVYNNQALYDALKDAPIEKINAQYINAIRKNGGLKLKQELKEFTEEDAKVYNPTEESYEESLKLLGKRLWRATTKNANLRKSLGYKFDSNIRGIDFDFDTMKENGTYTLENLEQMREELAYQLRISEISLLSRKGGYTKLRYDGLLNIYKKDTEMPDIVKHILDVTITDEFAYTNVQGTNTVEYAKMSYKNFIDDNQEALMEMIQTPGEVEKVIEFISSDPQIIFQDSEQRQRYQAYSIMMLAWIKNMNTENGLVLDNYHLELLDKIYNMIGHEWGTVGAALRTAVNLVSPTAYMLQKLSDIAGIKLDEKDLQPIVKAMRSGDQHRVSEEMGRLEKLIYEKGGDNKMSVLDMFFNLRSSFMLSSPGTWVRNISSNIILRGSMRAASAVGTSLAETIFRKTKGIEEKHRLWKIQGTQPTAQVKSYSQSVFTGELYELVKDSLNRYEYDEDKGPYKKKKSGELKLDENGEPVVNLNNNMYAHMIVETIKKRFYGATTYESSMKANRALKKVSFLGKMADKATNMLKKVLSDEIYIKARAIYYFDRMLTESIQRGDISADELVNGVLNDKIASILGQAFTEACADYMHKGSFLKDFENILYGKYRDAKSSVQKFGYGFAYSVWKFLLPYANAGWNWFAEGVKYTPVGIISGVYRLMNLEKDINEDPDNKMIAFRAKQELGKGVVGTTILGIGLALALSGLVGYDDEDKTIVIGDVKINISALFGSPAFTTGVILGSIDEDYTLWKALESSFDLTLDGFFLTDFINSISYTYKSGAIGFLETSVENMIQSLIPNVWKTFNKLISTHNYKTPSGFEGMIDRFFASLIPGYGERHLEKRIDPYTGEEKEKWDLPILSRLASLSPIKIFSTLTSDVEAYSVLHGVTKSESSGKFNDQESGEWSYDYDEYNKYRGRLNNQRVTEFMNDITRYEVTRDNKKIMLKASQMTDEEITKTLKRIYDENTTITKIWAWTQLGNKYYATQNMYVKLKKLGIDNIYLKSGKYSGYVKV